MPLVATYQTPADYGLPMAPTAGIVGMGAGWWDSIVAKAQAAEIDTSLSPADIQAQADIKKRELASQGTMASNPFSQSIVPSFSVRQPVSLPAPTTWDWLSNAGIVATGGLWNPYAKAEPSKVAPSESWSPAPIRSEGIKRSGTFQTVQQPSLNQPVGSGGGFWDKLVQKATENHPARGPAGPVQPSGNFGDSIAKIWSGIWAPIAQGRIDLEQVKQQGRVPVVQGTNWGAIGLVAGGVALTGLLVYAVVKASRKGTP